MYNAVQFEFNKSLLIQEGPRKSIIAVISLPLLPQRDAQRGTTCSCSLRDVVQAGQGRRYVFESAVASHPKEEYNA